jgi:hypothetical protein
MSVAKTTTEFSMFRRSWLTMPRKLAARRERLVRPSAFRQEILIGLPPFGRQKRDLIRTLLAKRVVGLGALLAEGAIVPHSFRSTVPGDDAVGASGPRLSVGLRTSRQKHLVGARPRLADDGVGRLVDDGELRLENLVRLFAFDRRLSSVCSRSDLGGCSSASIRVVYHAVRRNPERTTTHVLVRTPSATTLL